MLQIAWFLNMYFGNEEANPFHPTEQFLAAMEVMCTYICEND